MTDARPYFVVVSGLPGSGKTTLAHRLAPLLGLPVLDKDDELERLLDAASAIDSSRRGAFSRASDETFRQKALASSGALLVSFWRLAGMPETSGTPSDWLDRLPGPRLQVWCRCAPDIAASRFLERSRHPGHLDSQRSEDELLAQLVGLAAQEPLDCGVLLEVDTTQVPDVAPLAARIQQIVRAS